MAGIEQDTTNRASQEADSDDSDGLAHRGTYFWQCVQGGKSRPYTGFLRNSSGL
jgi:hypothetical protein